MTLAWLMFAATLTCLATGLVVALALVRPLTFGVLAEGAVTAVLYLGFAVLDLSCVCAGRPTRSGGCWPPPACSGP